MTENTGAPCSLRSDMMATFRRGQVIVFFLGGATYAESNTIEMFNREMRGEMEAVMGTTTMLNFSGWVRWGWLLSCLYGCFLHFHDQLRLSRFCSIPASSFCEEVRDGSRPADAPSTAASASASLLGSLAGSVASSVTGLFGR